MSNIVLKESGVKFEKEGHTYELGGRQLQGITGLLHEKLFPKMYAGISQATLDAAAERGTYVHEVTELYDDLGAETEGVPELMGYIRLKDEGKYESVASEYIVTDGKHWASAIDTVWTQDGESVVLVDKKTTSKYHREYVEWQLSIYAYLFEQMNPGVRVDGIKGCWLRGDKARLYEAKRHSKEEVERLLQSGVDGTPFEADEHVKSEEELAVEYMLIDLAENERKMKALKEERECLLARLKEKMDAADMDKAGNDEISVTRKADSVRSSFDSTRFKKDHADMYAEYLKESKVAGGLMVKLKEAK